MEFTFLESLMTTFSNLSISGMAKLTIPALTLLYFMAILDLTTIWGLYFGEIRMREMAGKAMKIAFFTFLILNWGPLTVAVEDSFIKIGQLASETTVSTKPATIMKQGVDKTYRLWNNIVYDIPMADGDNIIASENKANQYYDQEGNLITDANGKPLSVPSAPSGLAALSSIPGKILKSILCLVVILSFFWIGLQVLLCWLEFYVVSTLAIILLPFGVNNSTSFLSQKAIGSTVNFAIKLMVITFLLGVLGTMFGKMDSIANDDYGKIIEMMLESLVYAFLVYTIPSLVSSMLNGVPSLSGGQALQGMRQSMGIAAGGAAAVSATVTRGFTTGYRIKNTLSNISNLAPRYARANTSSYGNTLKKGASVLQATKKALKADAGAYTQHKWGQFKHRHGLDTLPKFPKKPR